MVKIRLFASSYAPLFAMLALRFEDTTLRVVLGITAAICFGDTIRIAISIPRHVGASPHTIRAVTNEGGQVSGYLATYLLPFLVVPEPTVTDLIAYILFLVVAGTIAVRSDLTYINPTLYLLGYRLIGVTTDEGFDGFAIVRSVPSPGDVMKANHLGTHVLVQVKT